MYEGRGNEGSLKQLNKLKNSPLIQSVNILYEEMKMAESIREIKSVKKLSGYDHFYRIRMGDYRLGFSLQENTIVLLAVAHRKDIYSIFP